MTTGNSCSPISASRASPTTERPFATASFPAMQRTPDSVSCTRFKHSAQIVLSRGQVVLGLLLCLWLHAEPAYSAASVTNTRFTVREAEKALWLVKPSGDRFFSLGVCCVNQGSVAS